MSRFSLLGARSDVNDALDITLGDTGFAAASPLRGTTNPGTYSSPSLPGGDITIVESVSGLTVETPPPQSVFGRAPTVNVADLEPTRCLLVTNPKTYGVYCFGIVGTKGEKFCMKKITESGTGTCGTSSHERKIGLEAEHLYYRDYIKQHGYTTPTLEMSHPMASELYYLKDDFLMRLHYKELIDLINHREIVESNDLVIARERVLKTDSGVSYTPRKKPRFTGEGESAWKVPGLDSMPTIPEISASPGEDPLGARIGNHMQSNWPAVIATVSALKSQISKTEKYEDEIGRLGDEFDSLSAAIARLQSLLGQPEDGSKFDVFKAVDDLEATVLELDSKVEAVKKSIKDHPGGSFDNSSLKDRIDKMEISLSGVSRLDIESMSKRLQEAELKLKTDQPKVPTQGLPTATPGADKFAFILNQQVVPALQEVWGLYTTLTVGPGKGIGTGTGIRGGQMLFQTLEDTEKHIARVETQTTGLIGQLEGRIKVVESKVEEVKRNQAGQGQATQGQAMGLNTNLFGAPQGPAGVAGTAIGGGWNGGFGGFGSGFATGVGGSGASGWTQAPPPTIPIDEARVATLEATVADLATSMRNMTVRISGHEFKSVGDCEVFVTQHVPGCTYGQFFDVVSLIQRSWGEKHKGLNQSWEEKHKQMKAGYGTKNEAIISASFETMIPTPLGENTGKVTEAVKPLTGIPTKQHWVNNGGLSGKSHDIKECINTIKPLLETQQATLFVRHPVGAAVCRELVRNAERHWTQFESMIDKFTDEFEEYSTRDEAWDLSTLIGKTVFEVVYQQRSTASDLSDFMTPAQRGGRVLWATLQAHRTMDEFATLTYRNHPRIAPVIVLHLLKNRVSKVEFNSMKDTLKNLSKQHDKLVSTVDKLTRKVG